MTKGDKIATVHRQQKRVSVCLTWPAVSTVDTLNVFVLEVNVDVCLFCRLRFTLLQWCTCWTRKVSMKYLYQMLVYSMLS